MTEGSELRQSGDLEAARRRYLEAHTSFPNARSLYFLGVIEFDLQHWPQSYAWLRQALTSQVRPLDSANRQEAEGLVVRARAHIGLFSIANLPENAEIEIDDGQPLRDGGELVLAQGPHTLVVRADGYETVERGLQVVEGEARPLPVTMQRVTVAPPAVTVAPPVVAVAPPVVAVAPPLETHAPAEPSRATRIVPESDNGGLFAAGGVTLGLGVAGLVVGIVGHALYENRVDSFNRTECNPPTTVTRAACMGWQSDWAAFDTMRWVGYIGGGIVSAVGIVLLIVGATSGPSSPTSSSTRFRCGSFADLGASCEGTF